MSFIFHTGVRDSDEQINAVRQSAVHQRGGRPRVRRAGEGRGIHLSDQAAVHLAAVQHRVLALHTQH